jgi:hypothetical protein
MDGQTDRKTVSQTDIKRTYMGHDNIEPFHIFCFSVLSLKTNIKMLTRDLCCKNTSSPPLLLHLERIS